MGNIVKAVVTEDMIHADVLVIGGGAAGIFAAVKAKENGANRVVLVEKAMTGKTGCSCFAAGVLVIFIPEEDDGDIWMKEYVEQGQYLNDQEWLRFFLEEGIIAIKELENWGLQIRKTPDGRYLRVRGRGSHPERGLRNMVFTGQAGTLTEVMRKKAMAMDIELMNWTMITDLMTRDETVVGAVGFDTRTGDFKAFHSKATVLASGSGMFRCGNNIGHRMNNNDATGIAYRAGVDLMNCDFTTHLPFCGEFKMGGMQMTVGLGGKYVNASGEQFMKDYDPVYEESAARFILSNAPLLELKGGRGPLYMDMTQLSETEVETFGSVLPLNKMILERAGVLVGGKIARKLEWSMQGPSLGVFSAGVKINTRCETSKPGLYAAGDAAAKMPSGTSDNAGNLAFAFISGARAGRFAAEYARNATEPRPDRTQVEVLKQYALGPLFRKDGVEGDYLIEAVQDIVVPYDVLMLRHGERMRKALLDVRKLSAELLPLLYAHDPHYLRLAHEAGSLMITAEIALEAGLHRKESRANIREDYTYLDNLAWLKWVHVKGGAAGLRLWMEDIPIERYPVKPPPEKYLVLPTGPGVP